MTGDKGDKGVYMQQSRGTVLFVRLFTTFFIVLGISTFFLSLIGVSAADMTKDVITWTTDKWTLTFTHANHSERLKADCQRCHHEDEKGKEQDCLTCHPIKPDEGDTRTSFKNAMHKQCKDCHKQEKSGPTKCRQCHIAKSGVSDPDAAE